nr:hypothetical protein [Tanacetum cinerariifolium]
CQPDNQNVDFSGSDQIQTLQYPDVNPPSPKICNEEIFQAKGDLMKFVQTFLESFNCIPFKEKPQILFRTWETFFTIKCSQPEDSNELFQKLLKDLKELAEYDQSTSMDRPIFLNDNEDHPVQNRESLENSFEENVEPPQDSNIHQLIDECCEEVPEEQNALDSKLLSINSFNSQCLDKMEQEIKNVEEQPAECRNLAPILSTKEPENSLSIGECEVTLEDKRECDKLICENSFTIDVCDNHSEILFDSNNDDLSSDDKSFEDIEYVDASVSDPEIVNVDEENVVQREEEEELLINDSILSHESSDSNFEDNPLILRPPPESPDDNFDLKPEVISAVMEDIDEPNEHFNPGGEIFVSTNNEDVDYFPFMFVI